MSDNELKYFEELKRKVVETFQKGYPNCNTSIAEWKGQEISDFQEDLIQKVKGRLSEKWFYTYIKSPINKLPRIDMLNLLSEYAGYKNWNDFIGSQNTPESNQIDIQPKTDTENIVIAKSEEKIIQPIPGKKTKQLKWLFAAFLLITLSLFIIKILTTETHKYKCCFVDIDGRTPIKTPIKIIILKNGESPVYAVTNNEGCIELNEQKNKISFIINTPYFKADSFSRILVDKDFEESIQLKPDDYSLMIHYFSKSKVNDWKKRREQLNGMIADNAKIFQVYKNNEGMELMNKSEFIDKLTIPVSSLKQMQIIEVKYTGSTISELRYIQNED